MLLPESRANRRRRWWLRAQAALSRRGPSPAVPRADAVTTQFTSLPTDWDLWRQAARIPPRVQLELYNGSTGQRLLLPLNEPRLTLGRDGSCDLRLIDPAVSNREVAFLWLSGQLHRVDLVGMSRRWHDAVHHVTPQDRWNWGAWRGRVIGLRESESASESPTSELQLELQWHTDSWREPVIIEREITWIGSVRGCDLCLPAGDAAAIQALLVRTSERLFVISVGPPGSTRVNGRAVDCAVLDAGDALGLGAHAVTLAVRWPSIHEVAAPRTATRLNESTFAIEWQAYLQQQADQQRLLESTPQTSTPTSEKSA